MLFVLLNSDHLEVVNLPPNLHVIGNRAFANCTSLKEVVIPDTLTLIEEKAFQGCIAIEENINSVSTKKNAL